VVSGEWPGRAGEGGIAVREENLGFADASGVEEDVPPGWVHGVILRL